MRVNNCVRKVENAIWSHFSHVGKGFLAILYSLLLSQQSNHRVDEKTIFSIRCMKGVQTEVKHTGKERNPDVSDDILRQIVPTQDCNIL
jgi:hypothetical protein